MKTRKTRSSGAVKRLGKGRVCKKFGCKQRLSIYNIEEFCNVHRGEASK